MKEKEYLSAKLDSERAFGEVAMKLRNTSVSNRWHQTQQLQTDQTMFRNKPWWLEREALRSMYGVYKSTEIIDAINQTFVAPMVLHVSAEDDKLVAYTASPEDGMRDKQIKTTMGRFLRKHFITLTDRQIQDIEQQHAAELTAEFLLASTRAEIREVYTGLVGDTGCMRHQPSHFRIANDIHPSAVYEAPGMGVAYTRDASGSISSRAVVWVNPADEQDKRFVRIYGAPVLRKILERNGYSCSSLEGAKLRKIAFVNSDGAASDHYVMPYLDGPDGEQGHRDGAFVVDDGDPEFFRLVTGAEQEMTLTAFNHDQRYATSCKSISAVIVNVRRPAAEYVSDVTGVTHDRLKAPSVFWLKDDMTVGVCAAFEAERADNPLRSWLRTRHEGQVVQVWCPTDTPSFQFNRYFWLDTDANRQDNGYYKLSALYYPDAGWLYGGRTITITVDGAEQQIKSVDAVRILGAGEDYRYVHVSHVPELRKQGYINCAPLDEKTTLIHRTRPTLRRTVGGTVFDSTLHDDRFVELITGGWTSKVSASRHRLFGRQVWVSRANASEWAKSVPTQWGIDAVAATAFGTHTQRTFDNLDFEGLNASAVTVVKTRMETKAGVVLDDFFSWVWALNTNDAGEKVISSYQGARNGMTWGDHLELLNYIDAHDLTRHGDARELQQYALYVRSIEAFLGQFMPKLTALIDQKQREEEGQQRIAALEPVEDAVVANELDALLAA